jgi:hypothetical protein
VKRAVIGRTPSILAAILLFLISSFSLTAMDRWNALSQLESGNDDSAVGAAGEISRYQIKPELWRKHATADLDWRKSTDALLVAKQIMQDRCSRFEASFHRRPTNLEFYILWNAPGKIESPSKSILQRAERFCNLLQAEESPNR